VALTTVSTLTPKSVLIQEIKNLKDTLAEQEALVIENEQIKEENEALKKELSYTPAVEQLLGAQVIGKPNQSLFNTLIIDRGSNQGVQLGQLVLAERSLGIGRVVGVSPTTATVELFGAPHFEGDVILAHKGVTVPAKGKGSGNFEIHIPREIAVADGDLLSFPEKPSIVIGVVKSVIFDPRDPFQTVLARLPVNVQELRFVEVLQ
jgi:rod shape-determining protein MreC